MISASIKQPNPANGLGYWPSFKAVGAGFRTGSSSWPAVGETDILEDVNGRNQLSATLHCGTAPASGGGPAGDCNEYNGMTSGLASCTGCQSGYHTYSEIIDRSTSDEQIRWYLDGRQVWQVNQSQVGVATWQAAVDHGFYLELGLAIGGSYPDTVCNCTSSAATSSGGALSVGAVTVSQTTGPAPAPLTDPSTPTTPSVVKVTGSQGSWQLQVNGSPTRSRASPTARAPTAPPHGCATSRPSASTPSAPGAPTPRPSRCWTPPPPSASRSSTASGSTRARTTSTTPRTRPAPSTPSSTGSTPTRTTRPC
ncbi:hypothetical protein ACFQZC_35770 [Streptacidiphilus monticola]